MTTPSPATRTLLTASAGLGSPSAGRLLAERLAAATGSALADRGVTAATRLVELREHAHDLTNAVVTGVPVYAATEDWGAGEGLAERITRAGGELAELVAHRTAASAGPYADPIPFERLLAG